MRVASGMDYLLTSSRLDWNYNWKNNYIIKLKKKWEEVRVQFLKPRCNNALLCLEDCCIHSSQHEFKKEIDRKPQIKLRENVDDPIISKYWIPRGSQVSSIYTTIPSFLLSRKQEQWVHHSLRDHFASHELYCSQ